MPHFKAPDGSLHFLDEARFIYLLPVGSVGISDAEAATLSAPSAEEQAFAQRTIINAERDAALVAGVVVGDHRFHSDDRFLTELLGFIIGYQAGVYAPTSTQTIRTMDNENVQLGVEQIKNLAAAVGAHRKAVYSASWEAKDAL